MLVGYDLMMVVEVNRSNLGNCFVYLSSHVGVYWHVPFLFMDLSCLYSGKKGLCFMLSVTYFFLNYIDLK